MKKTLYTAFIIALAVLIGAGSGYAGNGNGGNGSDGNGNGTKGGQQYNGTNGGQGNGTCTQANYSGIAQGILEGTPFVYEGTVISIGYGQGMVIATAEDNATVYGIGPVRYWDKLDVDRPEVGDEVSASGYTVNFSGVERNIAMTITVNGTEVQLRDPDTGKPLWRGGRYGGKK